MEPTTRLQEMEALLTSVERFEWRDELRLDVYLPAEKLLDEIRVLAQAGWRYLSAITGMDTPPSADGSTEGHIEILYHFVEGPSVLTLRISVPYSRPVAPSVCALIPYATLYERELIEMFGVELQGTPSTARLLLPDDWPDGVYPLRKEFKGL